MLGHKNLEIVEASLAIPSNELKRYNIVINKKRTSVTLEPRVWETFQNIAEAENTKVNDLCQLIATRRGHAKNMSSAIRVFLIAYLDARLKYIKKEQKDNK